MYCRNCGKELKEEWEICPYCGKAVNRSNDPEKNGEAVSSKESVQTGEEKADLTSGSKKVTGRLLIKIVSLVAVVCFFCPLYLFSCAGRELFTLSGLDITFGFEYMSEEMEGILSFGALLLLPLIAFLLSFGKKNTAEDSKKRNLKHYIGAACSFAAVLLALYFSATLTGSADGTPLSVTVEFAMILLIIANLLAAAIAFYQIFLCSPREKNGKQLSKASVGIRSALKLAGLSILIAVICLIPTAATPSVDPGEYLEETEPEEEPANLADVDMEDMIGATMEDMEAYGFDDTGILEDSPVSVVYDDNGKVSEVIIEGDADEAPSFHGVTMDMEKEEADTLLSDTYDILQDSGDVGFSRVKSETRECVTCALEEGLVKLIEYRTLTEEEYAEMQDEINASLYIFPDSDKRYLTEDEVRALDAHQLLLGRNEIFARHGRMFDMQELADYFNSQPWYNGTIPADQFDSSVLNDHERANADLIKRIEDEKNGTGSAAFAGKMGVYCSTTQPGGIETGRVEVTDLGNGSVQVDLGWLGGAVLLSETAQVLDSSTVEFTTYGITVTLIWSGDSNLTMIRSGGSLGDSYLDEITGGLNFVWAAEFNQR